MKKAVLTTVFTVLVTVFYSVAQTSSTTYTDYFGNKQTTYSNQYGETIGTSKTTTDYFWR
ncbi:MAG TPA: hypothetical protein VK021_08250 [Flavobacteriaceae bacterium]|nr:hypothetical protein [Flavobacteriaceae bacterium]